MLFFITLFAREGVSRSILVYTSSCGPSVSQVLGLHVHCLLSPRLGQDKKSTEEVLVVGEAFVSSLSWEKLRRLTVSSQSPFCKWTQAVVF